MSKCPRMGQNRVRGIICDPPVVGHKRRRCRSLWSILWSMYAGDVNSSIAAGGTEDGPPCGYLTPQMGRI